MDCNGLASAYHRTKPDTPYSSRLLAVGIKRKA
jgi:hypothetical protein